MPSRFARCQCAVRFGHRARRLGIMGLDPRMRCYRVLDANERLLPCRTGVGDFG